MSRSKATPEEIAAERERINTPHTYVGTGWRCGSCGCRRVDQRQPDRHAVGGSDTAG